MDLFGVFDRAHMFTLGSSDTQLGGCGRGISEEPSPKCRISPTPSNNDRAVVRSENVGEYVHHLVEHFSRYKTAGDQGISQRFSPGGNVGSWAAENFLGRGGRGRSIGTGSITGLRIHDGSPP
jgi:hypothetical protein